MADETTTTDSPVGEKPKGIYQKIFEIQQEITGIKKEDTNPFFKSKYFDVNKIIAVLRPFMTKHKLVLSQPLSHVESKPAITTLLYDLESGESISETIALPDLLDPQKMGSCITYYRRYALQSLFLLEALDDDANLASGKAEVDDSIETQRSIIAKCKTEKELNAYYKNNSKKIKNFDKNIIPLLTERKKELQEAASV